MKLIQKTFILFFLVSLMSIFPIYADEETELSPNENIISAETKNPFYEEIIYSDDDILLFDELLSGEAPLVLEYLDSDDDFPIDEDYLTVELALTNDPFYADSAFLYDDEFDDFFFFEAPDLIVEVPQFELRSIDDLFPALLNSQKRMAMTSSGLRTSYEKGGNPLLIPGSSSGVDLSASVMEKNPSHIIEALFLIPYNDKELDLLDVYNALGRIQNIKDQTLPGKDGSSIAIFKETTRLESAQRRRAVSDPIPAMLLPFSETMFLRLTDAYIGDLYLQGDMYINRYGITYNMTNFRDISFAIFPVMKAQRVAINIYVEPVKEGIIIYSMSGFYLPEFISKRMNLTSNINNRVTVLKNWITEGLFLQ